VLATRRLSRRIHPAHGIKPATVSLFFVNGKSDSIKIIANPEGIQALKVELEQAEASIRSNKSYFFGDPLWLRGSSRLVAVEPMYVKSGTESEEMETAVENTDLAPRIFLFSVVMIALTLMTVGVITICQWLF
jgi:hypothetical protein